MIKESDNESNKKFAEKMKECLDEYSDEESDKMFKESTQIKISNKNESTTNWYDKNKFKKILTTIDSNNFNHKM